MLFCGNNSDDWWWLDLSIWCFLFLLPKALDLEQYLPLWFPINNYLMIRDSWLLSICRPSFGPWSGCGPVTFQLLIFKGKQSQAKSSSRGVHWGMIIASQWNISRMKLSQSVLGLSSQRCCSGSSSISLGPGRLEEKSGWENERGIIQPWNW